MFNRYTNIFRTRYTNMINQSKQKFYIIPFTITRLMAIGIICGIYEYSKIHNYKLINV